MDYPICDAHTDSLAAETIRSTFLHKKKFAPCRAFIVRAGRALG